MNYAELDTKLQGRCRSKKKLANNTYAIRHEDHLSIRLRVTDIMRFYPDNRITVQVEKWRTVTTKDRLNTYLPAPWRIMQDKGVWYWRTPQGDKIFTDGDSLNGEVLTTKLSSSEMEDEIARQKGLRKKIKAYAKGFAEALPVPRPGGGDCFYCQMREVNTHLPLGEAQNNTEHLLSHIEEKYYVPSLLYRVLERQKCGPWWFQFAFQNPDPEIKPYPMNKTDYARFLRRYLYRQFGLA